MLRRLFRTMWERAWMCTMILRPLILMGGMNEFTHYSAYQLWEKQLYPVEVFLDRVRECPKNTFQRPAL